LLEIWINSSKFISVFASRGWILINSHDARRIWHGVQEFPAHIRGRGGSITHVRIGRVVYEVRYLDGVYVIITGQ